MIITQMHWEDFKTKFLLVADVHAPQITRKSEYTPWITNSIKQKINKKQIYHRDFVKKKQLKMDLKPVFYT